MGTTCTVGESLIEGQHTTTNTMSTAGTQMLCCLCGSSIEYNASAMCVPCLRTQVRSSVLRVLSSFFSSLAT